VWRKRGGGATHRLEVEAAALMDDAQLRVAAEQLDHAPGDRAIEPPRTL
jgi:nicotinate-nucleotide pyrophosphorylase